MKNLKRIGMAMVVLVVFCLSTYVLAAPVEGEILEIDNSYIANNGKLVSCQIQVIVYGDEYYTHVETLNGYTLIRDPETFYVCYAIEGNDGELVSSKIIYTGEDTKEQKDFEKMLEKANKKQLKESDKKAKEKTDKQKEILGVVEADEVDLSLLDDFINEFSFMAAGSPNPYYNASYAGSVKGLTLLIEFPDAKGAITPAAVGDAFNKLGTNVNSVRQYYLDVSGGALDYTNVISTYYYTAKYNKSYYTDPKITQGTRARELAVEALNDLKAKGFDFNQLSKDSAGRFRALNILYAGGVTNAWAEGLWPHMSSSIITGGGVSFSGYQITGITTSVPVSTLNHENGHLVMKWPDTYDYTHTSKGTGRYDLMCSNSAPPNPYFRCILAGWGTPEIMNNFISGSTIDIQANQIGPHIFRRSTDKEYFIVENVQPTGRWAAFGQAGLYIWHIDKSGQRDSKDMTPTKHYVVSLEQADGLFHLEKNVNSGDAKDAFYSGNVNKFTDVGTPNSKWWDGSASGLAITNISVPGNTMNYTYGLDTSTFKAPELSRTTPIEGQVDVNISSAISVVFTTPIASGTNYNNITLKDAQGNNVSIAKTISGSTLTIRPSATLKSLTQFILVVPAGAVNSSDGLPLAKEINLKFTTEFYSPIKISTASLPKGAINTKYSGVTLSASGQANGQVTWSATGLPKGLSIDSKKGTISGTPTEAGNFNVNVRIVDKNNLFGTKDFVLTIDGPAQKLVTGITLSVTSANIEVNKTLNLVATVSPSDASNKNIEWSSSNTNVVAVSSSGVVTGKAVGTATITAKAMDGSGKSATCTLTVTSAPPAVKLVTSVTLPPSISVEINKTTNLIATVSPSDASNKNITWSSNNSNVTVSSSGVVTGKAVGTAIITAKAMDGSGKSATCTVTVTATPTTGATQTLTFNGQFGGNIKETSFEHKINVTKAGKLDLKITNDNNKANLELVLIDSSGKVVQRINNDNGKAGNISADLPIGTYTARVIMVSGNGKFNYTLTATLPK